MKTTACILALIALPRFAIAQDSLAANGPSIDSIRSAWTPTEVRNRSGSTPTQLDSPTVIRFRDGRSFQTGLYRVEFQGLLIGHQRTFVVLSGRACTECDANISLYILNPLGPPAREAMVHRYWMAGRETDRQTGKLIRSSRGFVGHCLADLNEVVATYDSLVDGAGHWHTGLFVARIVADTIAPELRIPPPLISNTLTFVQAGQCREIAGMTQSSEP